MADNRFSSWKEDHLKGAMPMYVKQGLKREEAIDFVRERLALISAGVSKLSTNVCAISEFVTRTWGVIRVKIQFSCFAVLFCCFVMMFCRSVLTFYRSVIRA